MKERMYFVLNEETSKVAFCVRPKVNKDGFAQFMVRIVNDSSFAKTGIVIVKSDYAVKSGTDYRFDTREGNEQEIIYDGDWGKIALNIDLNSYGDHIVTVSW